MNYQVFSFMFIIIISPILTHNSFTNSSLLDSSDNSANQRKEKFFPLFSVVRFANSECSGSNNLNGTCFTRRECSNYKGSSAGSCANGLGVCCTFKRECGTTTNVNNTYFTNPGYSYEGGERCMITVYRCNSNICQLRIDFMELRLTQPNASGVCDIDFLLISGASSNVPRICGENNNQHMYLDFKGDNPITISVDTNTDYSFSRRWNLRIQQIACDSPWRAPNGCLQYYKTASGTVTSFNYDLATNPRVLMPGQVPGTRQMSYLNYGVCVRMAAGYCTIEWSQADSSSFSISGDSGSIDTTDDSDYADSGETCDHNFVIVPNPSTVTGVRYNTDRFCGNSFQTKQSSTKPFVLSVITNPDPNENVESGPNDPPIIKDIGNRGFILKYRQLACSV
ncbi:uncharacterized protein [Chelonus insularis]|uniref:uncharacterized protein n=1 Tax=Chelonus insularis TaxID=460826 RepID=UPI0015887823|nr:uncharacterized protein LOC118068672 [Chelonus insularis]